MNGGFTGRIARSAARRPWVTLSVWVFALAGAVYAAGGLGDALTQDDEILVATESDTAADIDERLRAAAEESEVVTETVVMKSSASTFGNADFAAALEGLTGAVSGVEGVGEVLVPTADAPGPVSQDGTLALATVALTPDEDGAVAEHYLEAVRGAEKPGFEFYAVGDATAEAMFDQLAEEGLVKGELIGIGVALVILVIVFGALVAAGLPILVAIVSIVMAIGATALAGQVFELSFFVVNMITMMGLALGIDYSLIMVQRFREELAHGREVKDAVAVAGGTANRAVFFSGVTVVISLMGLMLVPSTIMRSLGAGAIIVAVMAVIAALTLLPAVLALLGHRVNKGRVPTAHPGAEPRVWRRIAEVVTSRPAVWAVGGFIVLGLLATPLLTMRLTFPGIDALPEDNDLRAGATALVDEFGHGQASTMVVVEGADTATVDSLAAEIEDLEAFAETTVTWEGDVAFIDTRDVFDAADPAAEDAITTLRDEVVPQALAGTDAAGHVGGDQAEAIDFSTMIRDMTPWVLLTVLAASFVLLLVAFRSIVVPIVAIVLNLLSAAAAFGMLVAVFQWGWGSGIFGFAQVDGIAPWIPLFTFAVLFGLSMDYHVFLLSRIKERRDTGVTTREAVAFGLSRTGSLITGAALIMVAVFAGFTLGDLSEFAQMGFGLAAAVILDATLIRSVLVPSVMTLLGERNWYLPRSLQWLPQVRIEGGDEIPEASRPDEPELVRA